VRAVSVSDGHRAAVNDPPSRARIYIRWHLHLYHACRCDVCRRARVYIRWRPAVSSGVVSAVCRRVRVLDVYEVRCVSARFIVNG